MLQERLKLSERRACEIAGQHRSTQRHEPKIADDDRVLRARLRKLSARKPRWGYRRAHAQLLLEGFDHNRKRTQRIWREEGLRVPAKARKRRRLGASTAAAGRLSACRPNHVWALDFQHDATTDGRELKFLNVVDEFTREALAIECARTIDADQTVATLKRLVAERGGAPANLRADNGPELTARALAEWCSSGLTETAYIDPGAPWQNAWVESFNARLRDELLDVEEFSTLAEAQVLAADYRDDYNANHHHSALGMMAPTRFAASWQRNGGTNRSVNPELSQEMDR
jgi:putative transposase